MHTEAHSGGIVLTVNGESRIVPSGWSVADLLAEHALDPGMVVVEHNRRILHDRTALSSAALSNGDTIEIVHFVGGG